MFKTIFRPNLRRTQKTIYLDYAAATPVDPRVKRAMEPFLDENFYNPGGLARGHQAAREALEGARREVAEALRARPEEIIFTGGVTEADNLAILGVVRAYQRQHKNKTPHIIIGANEHLAIRQTCLFLVEKGDILLDEIPVREDGTIMAETLKELLRPETILVSVMYASNEVGTIQPIRDITKIVRWYKKQHNQTLYPLVHTDATQALNYLDIQVDRLGVDLMTMSSPKIYGPKGVGALYIKTGTPIDPIILGGSQEQGMRAGTENVAGIVGMATALTIARNMQESETARLNELRAYFLKKLSSEFHDDITIHGSELHGLPNIVSITSKYASNEQIVIELDARGIVAAARAACKSTENKQGAENGTVRFGMGRGTTEQDINRAVKVLQEILAKIKETKDRFTN